MKNTALLLMAAGTALLVGCASKHPVASSPEPRISSASAPAVGYDDRQIARIQRGETGEPQLLEWFGLPESRGMSPDGQVSLTWSFSRRTDGGGGHSGTLSVSLAPNGKVQAYSARGGPMEVSRTAEFVQKSDADLRENMERWRREGWNVLSISGPLRQEDGSIHRKAELSRSDSETASRFGYDDHRIAQIQRGETTSAQLQEWFGPAYCRNLSPDGRMQLAWNFGSRVDGGPGHSGELNVSLADDGKVDSYSSRRGPQ